MSRHNTSNDHAWIRKLSKRVRSSHTPNYTQPGKTSLHHLQPRHAGHLHPLDDLVGHHEFVLHEGVEGLLGDAHALHLGHHGLVLHEEFA